MKKANDCIIIYWVLFVGLLIVSCHSNNTNHWASKPDITDADTDSSDTEPTQDISDPWAAWYETDPQGRITENNQLNTPSEMLIISDDELASAWASYARLRTIDGHITTVVRLSDIPEQFVGRDAAETLRNFLFDQYQSGTVRFVLLGGDVGRVPFRRVDNYIYIPGQGDEYTANGPSESYFANIETHWDTDGDGIFGEKNQDLTLEQLRQSQLAVGRVSADIVQEVQNYTQKVLAYRTNIAGFGTRSLLMSDVASTLPLIGDVDAAEGIESTFSAFFPQAFKNQVQKLYATSSACAMYGAQQASPETIRSAMESGVSLIFHNGHGSHRWMTNEIDRNFVEELQNEIPSVFASCSCLSGNFADVTSTASSPWQVQTPDNDTAGERYILSAHGGVAYIGNTGTGLGPIGGSQFLHAFFEGMFVQELPTLGEIFNYARLRMRTIPYSLSILPSIMTDDSEWWTHHVLILLGDPSLPPWTLDPLPLQIEAPTHYGPGYQTLTIRVRAMGGVPRSGVHVTLLKEDDFLLTAETNASGEATFAFIPRGPGEIHVGASMPHFTLSTVVIAPRAGK